jgi:uncharacterized protein YcbK (DUF882 family)
MSVQIDRTEEQLFRGRRAILQAGALGGLLLPSLFGGGPAKAASFALRGGETYRVLFRNEHTDETFEGAYRVGGRYIPEAFERINHILRDFRTGEIFPIDPRVIDILYAIHTKTGARHPIEVLSCYRSPKTNNMLMRTGTGGVAHNSLHLTGQAIDIRQPGFSTKKLRDVGKELFAGGVGYYPKSNFVHLDTGRIRYW